MFHAVCLQIVPAKMENPDNEDISIQIEDVDLGSSSGRVKPMTIKLVFVASPLSTHAAIRSKSKDWLAENQDNVSECGDMSTHKLLFQRASSIKIQLSVLEQSRHHHLNVTCFHHE
jgi:hypothetical protein